MIKYLGSKRALVGHIVGVVQDLCDPGETVVDLFSGTARVGAALRGAGYRVVSNDINAYAARIADCYVASSTEALNRAAGLIRILNPMPGSAGYFTKTFCEDAMFFQPHNGKRVDAIRNWIARNEPPREVESILLTSLMEAADRVDNTCGVQMAYLKEWCPRSHKALELRVPDIPQGPQGESHQMDALEASKVLSGRVAYLDPPYNQHKYLGNYHIWETLVRWDQPEHYGKANKRMDVKARKSPFNSKPKILGALEECVSNLDAQHVLVSFSNEGYISHEEMCDMLSKHGELEVKDFDHNRYIGSVIGVHNPEGEKVSEPTHTKNKERIYILTR